MKTIERASGCVPHECARTLDVSCNGMACSESNSLGTDDEEGPEQIAQEILSLISELRALAPVTEQHDNELDKPTSEHPDSTVPQSLPAPGGDKAEENADRDQA